ncbi:glucosamine inositolphosphorylceramide transferase family protein [Fibrobacter succinogenes]|uniref:Glucosamine inositolphosphorylceramide transferase 1 N-terminal domain-containing protein n=1 Tax=Fibrobacter succinogenes TaxID=833 RepID=A0A380RUR3_FIBSU|nr:hypothetical protein [Fibrobacter succinogenes]PWJ36998.1 hypothetical protein IE02_0475 [Fibrobacter succinogenes subsp. elongatus]SUQ19246.1 hypothetical protein SAMN05661053_0475 [Fibrobacter succinogenes]
MNLNIKHKFRLGYWNVGIIEKSIDQIMKGQKYDIRWMKHRYRDRFFADPFVYGSDDLYYFILAEELIFSHKKGSIVLLTIDRNSMKLISRKEVCRDEYHLSYPNYSDDCIVPENYKSGGLYKFHIKENPVRKELLFDKPLIDPTFVEHGGKKWLFATTKENNDDPVKKLSIFYEENGCFVPHKKNPVKIDVNSARPGGKFFEYNGGLYRPAQNSEHLYGEDIRIMKVTRLDEEEFQEEQVLVVSSHNQKHYNLGLHTFNIGKGFVVVDGFEYSLQILQKIKNKILGM